MTELNPALRLALAREVVEGLSVGDAVGERLGYQHDRVRQMSDFAQFPPGRLPWTDDTAMALGILQCLERCCGIDEDTLAEIFWINFDLEPFRGYGPMAERMLSTLGYSVEWRSLSSSAFGSGSFGNGSAMRVAPVGAYFHDDLSRTARMAEASAVVTHFHPEGRAGAVAVAVATALAVRGRGLPVQEVTESIWNAVIELTPKGQTLERLRIARHMGPAATPEEVSKSLGCGYSVSCQDTVPYGIWNACRCLGDFREALLSSVEVGGDCDTTAAIVCGIVCGYTTPAAIPPDWLAAREKLPVSKQ